MPRFKTIHSFGDVTITCEVFKIKTCARNIKPFDQVGVLRVTLRSLPKDRHIQLAFLQQRKDIKKASMKVKTDNLANYYSLNYTVHIPISY